MRTPPHALKLVHASATRRDGVIVEQMVFGNDYRILVHAVKSSTPSADCRLWVMASRRWAISARLRRVIQRGEMTAPNFVEEHFLTVRASSGSRAQGRLAATILGAVVRSLR